MELPINKILLGDCLEVLKTLPDNSIDCCVTSPPYYGLRDYGCDGQIGLEETPEMFVASLMAVFNEVNRVLKKEGTLWFNMGDSYAGSGGCSGHTEETKNLGRKTNSYGAVKSGGKTYGVKPKDLIGIPWLCAFALRANGWYLRQDIIWHKPNPMPESVTDRCTKAHEYIFLLSKSNQYYYDNEAIKTDMLEESKVRNKSGWNGDTNRSYPNGKQNNMDKYLGSDRAKIQEKANKRSVWSVTTHPFKDAHFATFPENLIVDCIKAGCPEGGIVLDPFSGAGTTALVAAKLNRKYIGIELNPEYLKIAEKRISDQIGLFA